MGLFKKKEKFIGDGTCLWVSETGAISYRVFKLIKSEEKGKVVIDFGFNETYLINSSNIRAKRIIIYKTSTGKIICQNPDKWSDLDLKSKGIKEFRFNLQNFSFQEGKAAVHRWTLPKTTMDKLMPLFKILFICIAVAVTSWAAFKFGTYVLDMVVKARVMDCGTLIANSPVPIGVSNTTVPLGA